MCVCVCVCVCTRAWACDWWSAQLLGTGTLAHAVLAFDPQMTYMFWQQEFLFFAVCMNTSVCVCERERERGGGGGGHARKGDGGRREKRRL